MVDKAPPGVFQNLTAERLVSYGVIRAVAERWEQIFRVASATGEVEPGKALEAT